MAPPKKKQKKNETNDDSRGSSADLVVKGESAEYADKRSYRKAFKKDKNYAIRHNALMFVERGPFDWTKLHYAVWRDELESVKRYVEFHQTTKPEVLLVTGQWGETALQLALRMNRSPQMIKELLRGDGAEAVDMNLDEYYFKDIDNDDLWYGFGYYPIHEAVSYKNHEDALKVTKMLIENGADVNQGDHNGISPLSMAAWQGHAGVLELLVNNNAAITYNDESMVLHAAVNATSEKDAIACLKFLFALDKSNVNRADDRFGKTVLHTACEEFKVEVVEFLLKSGADAKVKDKTGCNPLNLIDELSTHSFYSHEAKNEYPKIKSLLKKYMAKKRK